MLLEPNIKKKYLYACYLKIGKGEDGEIITKRETQILRGIYI